ncbi:DgyrCDS7061 [Dimorphilus gyrociliatus]|uniref:Large ribosomal subunit protein mL43 n=1 Tax=Dimorphilus gyrociliatus TaxID=2664684 RepID=A0A7I8VQK2_9ANNE|nr:DgyrCDS7061 [Dimorphilus gyrociliatus]
MSGRAIPSDFVKSVLQNGAGRYVCQLQRLTFKFCKSSGGSRGTRDYIEKHLIDFSRENPGTAVYIQPRRHHTARVVAEFLNGNTVVKNINCLNPDDIMKWLEHLRTRSGIEIVRLRKSQHTDSPSIQGVWTPWTNKDSSMNISDYTDKKLLEMKRDELTATEKLLELAKNLREKDMKKTT